MPLDRLIVIHGDQLLDVIDGEVEEMHGDAIVRDRVGRLLARDCARRKLMCVLLPALDADARDQILRLIENWHDEEVRQAGHEIVQAAWKTDTASTVAR